MQRLKPFLFSVNKRLRGPQGPVSREVLQPEEVEAVTPPAMIPGSIDGIVSADARSTLAEQLERITTTKMRHAPLVREVFENAVAAPDGFATWRDGVRFNEAFLADALWARMSHVSSLRFPNTGVNRYYFGHWLMDGLSTSLIDTEDDGALMLPDPGSGVVAASRSRRWWNVVTGRACTGTGRTGGLTHADHYRRMLDLDPVPETLVRADRLITYRDWGQGSHKRARYQRMRQRIRDHFTASTPSTGVYIRRGTTGLVRMIENEDAICETLAARGWTILDIAEVSVEDLFYHIHGTRIVAGIDGSHLNHAILMLPDDGGLMVLAPPDRFTSTHMDHSRGAGLGSGYVVLEGLGGSYRTSAEAILKTADMMLEAIDRRSDALSGARPDLLRPVTEEERRQPGGLDVDVELGSDTRPASRPHGGP